jgi:hypothetical protein
VQRIAKYSDFASKKETVTRQAKRIFGNRVPEKYSGCQKIHPLFSFFGRLRYNEARRMKQSTSQNQSGSFDVYIRNVCEDVSSVVLEYRIQQ